MTATNMTTMTPNIKRKMKDSGIPWIGMIPEEWETCRFKDTHEGTNVGESIDKQYWTDDISHTPFYSASITQLHTNFRDFPAWKFTRSTDLLLSRNGTPYVYLPIVNAAYTDHIIRVSIKNHINKKYVKYCVEQAIQSVAVNTVSLATWSASIWNEQKLPVPPLSEQEAIAAWLDEKCGEIDELIEVEQKMIEELEAYRQATITETVTRGLNAQFKMVNCEGDWFTIIPEHWKKLPIRQIFRKRTEKNNPIKTRERLSLSIDKGITLYADKTTNLDRFKDDFTQYQIAHPNDIVLNSMNMIVGAVGKSKYHGCVSPVYYVIYPIDKNTSSNYYGYLLNIPQIRQVYHKLGKGIYAIERGEGRVNTCRLKVDYYEFGNIYVPFPPLAEQQAIADYLDTKCKEIDELIAVKREKIETLKQYRQSIIFETVTGKKCIE